ncbi:hypothetical protein [Marinobacter piscensis]|nr:MULTISPECIES: hypothetical protein [Marinobacter]
MTEDTGKFNQNASLQVQFWLIRLQGILVTGHNARSHTSAG